MNALETELQRARAGQAGSDKHRLPEPCRAQDNSRPADASHFSPDPMHYTDRYRLVTPYRLTPLD